MENGITIEYGRLNKEGQSFVDCAIKAALKNPLFLLETPLEEVMEIKNRHNEADKLRKLERENSHKHFEEVKAQCENMTKEDYIAKLNEVFVKLPTYKLRYFFIFINAKLGCDVEGGVVNA